MKKITVKVAEHEHVMKDWDWSKNEEHPETIRATSPLRAWWSCHVCKHSWQTAVSARVGSKNKKGSGCPACYQKTGGTPGKRLNDFPELMTEFSEINVISPEKIYPSSSRSIVWICPKEGHLWKGAVNKRIREGLSCTICSGDFKPLHVTHPHIYNQLQWEESISQEFIHTVPNNIIHPELIASRSKMRATWKCEKCSHSWRGRVSPRVAANTGCPQCWRASHAEQQLEKSVIRNGAIADHEEIMKEWDWEKNTNLDPKSIPSTWTGKAWWKCAEGHSWHSKVGYRLERDWVCPRCAAIKSVNDHYTSRTLTEGSLATNRPLLLEEWDWDENQDLNPYELLIGSHRHAWWVCRKCDHEWKSSITNRATGAETGCPQCALETWVSKGEQSVAEYVQSITNYPVNTSVRSVIPPRELDIYLPDLQFAIEFNGNYWHSEHIISARYGTTPELHHQLKRDLCAAQQVTLAYVWENDWNHHRLAVEEALQHLLTTGELFPILTKLRSDIEPSTPEDALANVPGAEDDLPEKSRDE